MATHLKQKAANFRQEGPCQDGYFLLPEHLQAHFGHASLVDSSKEEKGIPIKEEEGAAEETKTEKTKEIGNLASAELVFPFRSIPLVVTGIPKDLLPLHCPEVQSHYHC